MAWVPKVGRHVSVLVPTAYTSYTNSVTGNTASLYWKLDETSGVAAIDSSGNSRTGTYVGGFTQGLDGPLARTPSKSVELNGSTGRVISSAYTVFVPDAPRVFSGWAWRDNSNTDDTLFCGNGATGPPQLQISAGGNNVVFYPAYPSGAVTWTDGWPGSQQWVYWVLVFDDPNNSVQLYINGVNVGTKATTTTYGVSPGNFAIGGGLVGNAWFLGKMSNIAIYESLLTNTQITNQYKIGWLGMNQKSRVGVITGFAADSNPIIRVGRHDTSGTAGIQYETYGNSTNGVPRRTNVNEKLTSTKYISY